MASDSPKKVLKSFQVTLTTLLGGMESGGTALGDVVLGDVPGFCWEDMDFEDIQIHVPSPPKDILVTSLATNPWGSFNLEDI